MESLFIPLALAAGSLLTVQAGANAQLSQAAGSPLTATTIQLSVGAIVLLLVAAITGSLDTLAALPTARWWHAAGGVASAFYVASSILLFPRLGAVVSVGLFIAGQMIASLLLDTFGLLGVRTTGIHAGDMAGVTVVLGGAALIVAGQQGGVAGSGYFRVGWIVLALLAGAVLPVQGAVNALLRVDLGGASFAVGSVSFIVATLAMAVVVAATAAWAKLPPLRLEKLQRMPWWGWLGGLAGASYVTAVFLAIPAIGAAAAVGLTVAGQQVASVFVDKFGWFRLQQRPVSRRRLAGVVLLLSGSALVALTQGGIS